MAKVVGNSSQRRPSKNVLMFFLSMVVGGVGVFYSKQYIEEQINHYKNQLNKTETMLEVVVPIRQLVRGEIVTADDLAVREIPEQYFDSNSVTADRYDVAVGQRIDFDIDEGRPLLWAHLEGGLSPTFSGKVPSGLRAMTIRVDEINSISGFLQPQDSIDLLLSYGAAENRQIFPLIQNLSVIATGVQTLVDKKGITKRDFNTITIQVSPEQAKRITLSQQVGKITAMLRNPEDNSPLSEVPMNMAQVLNLPKPAPKPKKVIKKKVIAKPGIEYIIGGS